MSGLVGAIWSAASSTILGISPPGIWLSSNGRIKWHPSHFLHHFSHRPHEFYSSFFSPSAPPSFFLRSRLLPVFLGNCSTAPSAPVDLPEEPTALQGTKVQFFLVEFNAINSGDTCLRPTFYWPPTSVKRRLAEPVRFAPPPGRRITCGRDYWCHQCRLYVENVSSDLSDTIHDRLV